MLKTVGDFFLDKSGNGDEKRLIGIVFLGFGLAYALGAFGKTDNTILLTLLGTGGTLLGISAVTDGIK